VNQYEQVAGDAYGWCQGTIAISGSSYTGGCFGGNENGCGV